MSQSSYKRIGEYKFYSQEEYKEGLNDLKKIKTLMNKGNLEDPRIAAKLYQQLLSYPDMFESCIGEEFIGKLLHCSNGHSDRIKHFFTSLFLDYNNQIKNKGSGDITARTQSIYEHSERAITLQYDEKEISNKNHAALKNTANKATINKTAVNESAINKSLLNKAPIKGKRGYKKEISIFLAGMLTCFILYTAGDAVYYKISTANSVKKLKMLATCVLEPLEVQVSEEHRNMDQLAELAFNNISDNEDDITLDLLSADKITDNVAPGVLHQYSLLYEMNSDIVGWIKIDNTVIDYPVMQTKDNEEFYLYRDFDKEKDKTGLPFMDSRVDILKPVSNMLIHGHNMKNGSMFAALLKYKQEDYYKKNNIIHFDTIYETADYEIVAAFLTRVAYKEEDVFRYYNFINAETKEEYDTYIEEIKKLSYYDTGITAEYGDTLITLSTCDRSIEDGRFVVVAKKISKANN